MTQIFGYSIPIPPWLTFSIFFAAWVVLSFLVSHLFGRYVRRWAEKTKTRFDLILVGANFLTHGIEPVLKKARAKGVATIAMKTMKKIRAVTTTTLEFKTSGRVGHTTRLISARTSRKY